MNVRCATTTTPHTTKSPHSDFSGEEPTNSVSTITCVPNVRSNTGNKCMMNARCYDQWSNCASYEMQKASAPNRADAQHNTCMTPAGTIPTAAWPSRISPSHRVTHGESATPRSGVNVTPTKTCLMSYVTEGGATAPERGAQPTLRHYSNIYVNNVQTIASLQPTWHRAARSCDLPCPRHMRPLQK